MKQEQDIKFNKSVIYSPPWADVSIIGIAGSSGSGKSTLSQAIVKKLDLPWVVIMSMDSFYKPLIKEQSIKAFQNEYDFDAPEAIDFEVIIDKLRELKAGKRAEIPVYSFKEHRRLPQTTTIYSPHVLILEGIFALYDERVRNMCDLMIFCEADLDTCLGRRLLRDVNERGRDINGCIKQWETFVKPNYEKYVDPQRKVADIIVPRGIENTAAMAMMTQHIERILVEKSVHHRQALRELEMHADQYPLSKTVHILPQTPQLIGMNTIIQDIDTSNEDFIFYFERLACLLIEQGFNHVACQQKQIITPGGYNYAGCETKGEVSVCFVLRGGAAFESSVRRIMPDCKVGRMIIQSNMSTGEPELHFTKMAEDVEKHESVMLIDTQIASGGSALMAVQVLIDHGVPQGRIVFIAYSAGRLELHRLSMVFPKISVVVCSMVPDIEKRWVEERYFRC